MLLEGFPILRTTAAAAKITKLGTFIVLTYSTSQKKFQINLFIISEAMLILNLIICVPKILFRIVLPDLALHRQYIERRFMAHYNPYRCDSY